MFILLNGSFGIGKTATAACLRRELPGSTISDPERVGYVLRRLPAFLLGLQEQPADYQDMALWRRLIVHQARIAHRRARTVIVPWLSPTGPILRILLGRWPQRRPCIKSASSRRSQWCTSAS
ncbi:hypothetical protein [Devosia sp.]|uniref:hypothetical protein n=1 Tax=Devosia sp. TaxID=1871048 RepID=UPI001B13725D|nr:hypothetical protein [Devosia sp.]MBO9590599.1 hypothetical protein [Devosia sp.]